RSILTIPVSPRMAPTGGGMSLIRNVLLSETVSPPGNFPLTLILTSRPAPGFVTYFPAPPAELKPGALALTAPTPGIDIVIGFATPRYTTFILSAEITAEFGFGITA